MKKFWALSAMFALSTIPARALPPNPATAQFNVTITVLKQCTVSAPATLNLGSVGAADLISTTTTTTQTFSVICSKGTGYTIGFSSPNDLSAGSPIHMMIGGTSGNSDKIQYNLIDATPGATNTTPLSQSTSVMSDTGTGATQTKTLKAQVVNYTTAVTPDVYSDTVTMTVSY